MDPILGYALLSVGGGVVNNWFGNRNANKQMQFQERMASTQAQRSQADFRAAGLNPALAYGNMAASPTGSMHNPEDAVNKGLSSARDAKALQNQLDISQREQRSRDKYAQVQYALTDAQRDKTVQEAHTAFQERLMATRENSIQQALMPHSLKARTSQAIMADYIMELAKHDATIRNYEIPGARNTARWEEMLGLASPGLRAAAPLTGMLTGSARAAGALLGSRKPLQLHKSTTNINLPRSSSNTRPGQISR